METVWSIIELAWPRLLLALAFIWSLLNSPFAWWVSCLIAKKWWRRILNVMLLWPCVIAARIFFFVLLLRRGIMLWTQVHAWGSFVRLCRCFVESKKEVLIVVAIASWLQNSKNATTGEKQEFTFEELCDAIKTEDALLFDDKVTALAKLIFCATRGDQDCIDALRDFFLRFKDNKNLVNKLISQVLAFLCKVNVLKLQESIISTAKCVVDMVIEHTKSGYDSNIAFECVQFKQLLKALEGVGKIIDNRAKIEALIDAIAVKGNIIAARLYLII